jgi:hypothetical protein
MLRYNKHLEKLILDYDRFVDVLEILKVVASHGSLRHLCFSIDIRVPWSGNYREEWNEVFSQICAKLVSFNLPDLDFDHRFDCLPPLVNAKNLTQLTLGRLPTSETFRQMADNYICLQNVNFHGIDCSEHSDVAYFIEKQCETLTSLVIYTSTSDPLPAIFKCRHLKKLHLFSYWADINLDRYVSIATLLTLTAEHRGRWHRPHYK